MDNRSHEETDWDLELLYTTGVVNGVSEEKRIRTSSRQNVNLPPTWIALAPPEPKT